MEQPELAEWEERRQFDYVEIQGTTWLLITHWQMLRGRLEVVGMQMWSVEPFVPDVAKPFRGMHAQFPDPAPVTTAVLRDLKFGGYADVARAKALDVAKWVASPRGESLGSAAQTYAGRLVGTGTRRQRYTESHYREVAQVYRSAYRASMRPTQAVARHFGATDSAAAKWVAKARELGYLPKTTAGRAAVVEVEGGNGQ